MNNDKIKRENRKALKVFIPIIIVAGLVGGLFGYFSQTDGFQHFFGNLGFYVGEALYEVIPYLVIAVNLLPFLIALVYYYKGKSLFRGYEALAEVAETDEDEAQLEAVYERIDRKLSFALIIVNLGMLLGFLFFGIFMANLTRLLDEDRMLPTLLAIVFFIVGMFINLRLQQLAIDSVKKMNPKMQGSVYDMKFQEKWEASCDEAEKMTIYKASYKAFQKTNLAFTIMWVVLCLGDILLHFGALPVVSISIVWIVMTASYYMESFKLEHGKINE